MSQPDHSNSVQPPRSEFAGSRSPPEIIVLAVRRYLRFGPSYPDVEELLAERGVEVDHVTVYRGIKTDRGARVVIAGHAFVQNIRRGHYELAAEASIQLRLAVAFDELALAM